MPTPPLVPPPTSFWHWLNARLPLQAWGRALFTHYDVPRKLNFWYCFGALALLILVLQVLSGIVLAVHYQPLAALNAEGLPFAFASIARLMKDVPWGGVVRYMHSTGASAFFVVIYLHIFRALLYRSYRAPRELVWLLGMVAYALLMIEAMSGYILPWGQHSFWSANVVSHLLEALPLVGERLADWLRGGDEVGEAMLSRLFVLHILVVPLALVVLTALHIVALRTVGSSNPAPEIVTNQSDESSVLHDNVAFYPHQVIKDLIAVIIFLVIFAALIIYAPEGGGYLLEAGNHLPANPLATADDIRPMWYLAPFYAIMRSMVWTIGVVEARVWGVLLMLLAFILPCLLPWLDHSQARSLKARGRVFKCALSLFVIAFITLGAIGLMPVLPLTELCAQLASLVYFMFFLTMPWWSREGRAR